MRTHGISEFYPPRARFYSHTCDLIARAWRKARIPSIDVPTGVGFWPLIGGIFVPGLGFWLCRRTIWTRAAMWSVPFLILVFFVFLGERAGNLAFTILLSLHSTALTYLLQPWVDGYGLRQKLFLSMLVFSLLTFGLYNPARQYVERHLFLPLRVDDHTIVIHNAAVRQIHRGDWVAYAFAGDYQDHVLLRGGKGLAPVIGIAGDTVEFTDRGIVVNDILQPFALKKYMPRRAKVDVPAAHVFIWPEFEIRGGHGGVTDTEISNALLGMACIENKDILGKPFKHWFWHKQVLE